MGFNIFQAVPGLPGPCRACIAPGAMATHQAAHLLRTQACMQTSRQTAGVSYVQALPAGMEAAGSCSTVLPHLVIRPPCPSAPEGTLHSTLLQVLLTEVRILKT